jgi:hypothetical protein
MAVTVGFSLRQFSEIFKIRDSNGQPYILIGGQAVNYWAEHYLSAEPQLAKSATTGKAGGLTEVERLKAAWPFGRWLCVQAVPDDSDVRASPALLIAVRDWPGAQPSWLSPSEADHGRS